MPKAQHLLTLTVLIALVASADARGSDSERRFSAQRPIQLAQTNDTAEASLRAILARDGDMVQQMRDNAAKIALYRQALENLQGEKNEQGGFRNALDDAMTFIPAMNLFSRTGNVPGALVEVSDLPSTRENKEAEYLWGLPLNQFAKELPVIFEDFGKQFGGMTTNLTQALRIAKQYQDGGLNESEARSENLWDGMTVLFGVLLFVGAAWYLARHTSFLTPATGIRNMSAGQAARDHHMAILRNSKTIILSAATVAVLMFLFPPTNRNWGTTEIFTGWHPIWTLGYVEEEAAVRSIAYLFLLCQWGLLAAVTFALHVSFVRPHSDNESSGIG